jgi:hypothetical protein
MDGFFVAKFKVEKRVKGQKTNGTAADEDEDVDVKGIKIEGDAKFNDDVDEALIEGEPSTCPLSHHS